MTTTTTKRAKADAASNASDTDADTPLFLSVLDKALPFLSLVDIVRISGTSPAVHEICAADDVWAPWLDKIHTLEPRYGSVLERIRKAGAAPFLGKTLMAAYMAATTPTCICGEWGGFLNALTLEPQCFDCFKRAREGSELIMRSEARDVYALPDAVLKTLPHIVGGSSHAILARAHVEALAEEYHETLDALMERKQELRRVAEAEFSYTKSMAELKGKAARARGLRAPHSPPKPYILNIPLEIDWDAHSSSAKCSYYSDPVLIALPFPSKTDPAFNSVTGEIADRVFTCPHCERRRYWDGCPRFPSAALLAQHEATCPHRFG